jgi:hypothetical protein
VQALAVFPEPSAGLIDEDCPGARQSGPRDALKRLQREFEEVGPAEIVYRLPLEIGALGPA